MLTIDENIKLNIIRKFDNIVNDDSGLRTKLDQLDNAFNLPMSDTYKRNSQIAYKNREIKNKIKENYDEYKEKYETEISDVKIFSDLMKSNIDTFTKLDEITLIYDVIDNNIHLKKLRDSDTLEGRNYKGIYTNISKNLNNREKHAFNIIKEFEIWSNGTYKTLIDYRLEELLSNIKSESLIKLLKDNYKRKRFRLILERFKEVFSKEYQENCRKLKESYQDEGQFYFTFEDLKYLLLTHFKNNPRSFEINSEENFRPF